MSIDPMPKLRISPDLAFPEDTVTSTLIVYGGKGMGKTNFGSVLVEELTKARLRWSFLDPMGVAWGLRHSPDGAGPGIECVILGGPHGDIPIEPTRGDVVADFVVDESVNTIIDFSRKPSGDMWSNGERIRFVTDYARRLFSRQGQLVGGRRREPLFQILDEAARYIPQVIPSGRSDAFSLADCLGAWEQAAEEGRNVGLGVGFLTQRSARINKSVAELADAMIAFRTIGPNSIEAVTDWLGSHVEKGRVKELTGQVRELAVGSALVVSPGWLKVEKVVPMRARETFDSSATPKPGERARKVSGPGATPDLEKYRARMAETIERAKADDPKELRKELAARDKQIVTLTRERDAVLAKGSAVSGPEMKQVLGEEYERGRVVGYSMAIRGVVALVDQKLHTAYREATDVVLSITAIQLMIQTESETAGESRAALAPSSNHKAGGSAHGQDAASIGNAGRTPAVARRIPRSTPRAATATHDGVTGVEQRILNTIRGLEELGVRNPDKATVAALVGYHPNAKSYANAMGSLRTSGRVAYPSAGTVALTEAGLDLAENSLPVRSRQELHDTWYDKLGNVPARILRPLIESHPDPIDAATLAEMADYHPNAKSFANAKGRLRTLGLIDYPAPGMVVATDILFPAGLR